MISQYERKFWTNYKIFQLFSIKVKFYLENIDSMMCSFCHACVLLKIFISSFSTSFTSNYILRVLIAQHEFGIFIFFCSIWTLLEMISFVQYGQNVAIWRWIINVYIITWLLFVGKMFSPFNPQIVLKTIYSINFEIELFMRKLLCNHKNYAQNYVSVFYLFFLMFGQNPSFVFPFYLFIL